MKMLNQIIQDMQSFMEVENDEQVKKAMQEEISRLRKELSKRRKEKENMRARQAQ